MKAEREPKRTARITRFPTIGLVTAVAAAAVLALGGASWPRLGSDGSWQFAFAEHGARIASLRPANSGFLVSWSPIFREKSAGQPLKRILLRFEGQELRGEALLTSYGIEGNAIYALSNRLREAISRDGQAELEIDLLPDISIEQLAQRLESDRKDSMANRLRKAGLFTTRSAATAATSTAMTATTAISSE